MPRLCLTAANPSAANMVAGLLYALGRRAHEFDILILAQEPAYTRLCGDEHLPCHVNVLPVMESRDSNPGADSMQRLSANLIKRFAEYSPDVVISGLSGPDLGIDEWAVHHARAAGIPTFSLQDSPGWVVDGIDGCADTYLVESLQAAEMTAQTGKVARIEVIGSLRRCYLEVSRDSRRLHAEERRLHVFFGQPLWQYDGYRKSLVQLANHYQEADEVLAYRPHPLESVEQLSQLPPPLKLFAEECDYWTVLTRSQIAYSCFSTALTDVALVASLTRSPPQRLSYLLIEEDIRQAFHDGGGDIHRLHEYLPGINVLTKSGQIGSAESSWRLDVDVVEVDGNALAELLHVTAGQGQPGTPRTGVGLMRKAIAAFPTLDDVSHRANPVEQVVAEEIRTVFREQYRFGEICEIIPRYGDQGYFRAEDLHDGCCYFIKSVSVNDLSHYQRVAALEHALSERCESVLPPVSVSGLSSPDGLRFYFAWHYLDNVGQGAFDKPRARVVGEQMAILHRAMRQVSQQEMVAEGEGLKQRIQGFLHTEVLAPSSLSVSSPGVPDGYISIMPESKVALHALADSGFFHHPSQMVHGDLNLGNIIYPVEGCGLYFIDFEEALSSQLPVYFDMAFFIERNFLHGEYQPKERTELCRQFILGYLNECGTNPFPQRDCLISALIYSQLRSMYVLVTRSRNGLSSPVAEWRKLEQLLRLRNKHEMLLRQLTEY